MALDAAAAIVDKGGLRSLSVRGIAQRMGYVPGTLYQLFTDLDELIVTMNCETLEALFVRCQSVDLAGVPEETLVSLAEVYIEAVREQPQRWNAVFEYNPPIDAQMPERYMAAVRALLGLVRIVMTPLYAASEEQEKLHDVRVLWAGLYGIATLASSRKSSAEMDPRGMVQSLATTYLAGLRSQKRSRQRAKSAKRQS